MNKTSIYDLTIILPVYNEQDNMDALEQALANYLPKAARNTCVLFVNDGSNDNSLNLIKDICQRHTSFFYISLEKNSGLSAAMKAGIDVTQSPFVGYLDSDL